MWHWNVIEILWWYFQKTEASIKFLLEQQRKEQEEHSREMIMRQQSQQTSFGLPGVAGVYNGQGKDNSLS